MFPNIDLIILQYILYNMEDPLNTTIDSSNKNTLEDEDLFIGYKNWNRLVAAASTVTKKA